MALFDYVSGASDFNDTNNTTIGPISLAVTADNLLIWVGKWEAAGASDAATLTLNDGGVGLTWSSRVYSTSGSADPSPRVAIAWAIVGSTGTASVTGTLDTAREFKEFHLHQFEVGASYTVSEIATATGNSATAVATWSAGSVTAAIDDLLACAVVTGGGSFTITANSPLSVTANAQGRSKLTAGKATSAGSTAIGGNITDDSHVYAAAGFQLRASGGGGGGGSIPVIINHYRNQGML